jgi:hypothetical protein
MKGRRTDFKERQKRFPILKAEPDLENNTFAGTKRAFVVGHGRKSAVIANISEFNWRVETKAHQWAYQREFEMLMTSTRVCDDETLRRANRKHYKHSEVVIPPTTGPRMLKKLPPEVQDSTYPRYHRAYFGA